MQLNTIIRKQKILKMAGKPKKDFNKEHGVTDTTVNHLVSDTLVQSVYYPAHPPRKESGIYRKTHQLLIYKEDMPCWVCGVKESNIKGGWQRRNHIRKSAWRKTIGNSS